MVTRNDYHMKANSGVLIGLGVLDRTRLSSYPNISCSQGGHALSLRLLGFSLAFMAGTFHLVVCVLSMPFCGFMHWESYLLSLVA